MKIKSILILAAFILIPILVFSGNLPGPGGQNFTKDPEIGGIVTITTDHYQVHVGNAFQTHYEFTTAATDDLQTAIYLKTPTDKEIHMVASFSVSHAGEFFICEDITIDANEGTSAAVYNRNRNSLNTSTVFDNATVPVVNKVTTWTPSQMTSGNFTCGTEIEHEPLVAAAVPKQAGGNAERGEIILKKNTEYLFMDQNIGANANTHHIWLRWYEVE